LLGAIILTSGMGNSIYEAVYRWLSRLPAGLAISTTVAVAIFSAVSGSSLACAITFSKVSIPEMVKRGYDKAFSAGLVAAAATQDSLIPPSGLLVLYAILTEQSIGKCLMAGFLPGIISILLYIGLILILKKVKPHWFGTAPSFSMKERMESLKGAWQIPLLAVLVLGATYTGITTATEAAAVGTFMAIILGIGIVGLKRLKIREGLITTITSSGMLFAIIIGSFIFGGFLNITRIPAKLSELVVMAGLSKWVIFLIIIGIYTILGMIMSATAFLVATMPIIFPIITSMKFDPIWFGVVAVKMCGIGMLSPPVGLCVYATKGAVGDLVKLEDMFKVSVLFLIADYICLILICFFPDIVLFLPDRMVR
jgi:C4-dicarboxylate transporter DctM subunit